MKNMTIIPYSKIASPIKSLNYGKSIKKDGTRMFSPEMLERVSNFHGLEKATNKLK